jgi:hypothetical protein
MESHLCLAVALFEFHRNHGLDRDLLLPAMGEDQPLGRGDLAVDAATQSLLPSGDSIRLASGRRRGNPLRR